ncbi:MAG: hypothetical protein V4586_17960 [Pseudomonadota bacterium]
MRDVLGVAILGFAFSGGTVFACATYAEMDYRDILRADLVVVGDVLQYEIIDPDPDPNKGRLLNYARFDVRVREVLAGPSSESVAPRSRADQRERTTLYKGSLRPGHITVTWDNSTFGEPEDLKSEGYSGFLIALRDPVSPLLPLRSGSAFIAPTPEPEHYTVLQAPCSGAFIFEMDSLIAIALRQLLVTDRDKDAEWQVLSEFLFDNGAAGMVDGKLMQRRLAP